LESQLGFAVFEKHRKDFAKIHLKLVQGLGLGMCAREARDVTDEKPRIGIAFNDCGVGFHSPFSPEIRNLQD
jgi:hypothetical protein